MARLSSPQFRLFTTRLVHAHRYGRAARATQTVLPKYGIKTPSGESDIPNALRWTTHPSFAFPRQPFKVWRRVRKYRYRTILRGQQAVAGEQLIEATQGELYRAEITVSLISGQQMTVEALDRELKTIPGQSQVTNTSETLVFRSPFMKFFRFDGSGQIVRIRGVVQSELINDPSWELIQRVGFPFKQGAVSAPAYDPEPQGWSQTGPVDPYDFGYARLALGFVLQEEIPALPAAGLPHPVWGAPAPGNYLHELADQQDSLLSLIRECLVNTDDHSALPANRQQAYTHTRIVSGLRQDGFPGTVDPATAVIPVTGTALLSASTDNFASLGLGYGTYDFPPFSQVDNRVEGGFDYMVTNAYLTRPFENTIFPDRFAFEAEFAALGEFRERPDTPDLVEVRGQNQNRPLVRDEASDETVRLRFRAPAFPQGYGIIRSDPSQQVEVLNSELNFSPKCYLPYIPHIPNAENAGTVLCNFTDPYSPVPLNGTETYQYFLAAVDLFGRWSGFDQRSHVARAIPPQRPGLISLKITPKDPEPATRAPEIACTIEIDCTWDCTERTPDTIEISGGPFPADGDDPSPVTDKFLHNLNGPLQNEKIRITFNTNGEPVTTGPDYSVETVHPTDPGADPNLKRYRVTIENVTAIFPGPLIHPATPPDMDPSRVAYIATARALEKVRVNPVPVWSEFVNPVVDKLDDPRPPAIQPLDAGEVRWTALPDAANRARGVLDWDPADGAAGYFVWEAPETALRELLGMAHTPGDSFTDRLSVLNGELGDPDREMESLKAFSRLNRDPIRGTSFEITLPGSADTLYAYRVSAVSVSNVESGRSNAVFFAVPRQHIPGQPGIRLNARINGSAAIEVTALPGAGAAPAGYKVYRVRRQPGSNMVQMKGLPVITENNGGWSDVSLQNLDGTSTEGKQILDPVTTPSWRPYFYQVVAVGEENSAEGLLRGESEGSVTEVTFFPPSTPPVMVLNENQLTAATHFIALTSDTPFDKISLGKTILEIASYQPETAGAMPVRETILSGPLHTFKKTDVAYTPASPALADISEVPEVTIQKNTETIYIRMNPAIKSGFVTITDPLGRSSEIEFEEP